MLSGLIYKYVLSGAAIALCVFALSCDKSTDPPPPPPEIVIPPAPQLRGTYKGVYYYTTNYSSPNQTVVKAHVKFVFDETKYHMNVDTLVDPEIAFEIEQCFCAVDGQYALTEGVRLTEESSGPQEGCDGLCDEELNPEGTFTRETKGDSLIMKYQKPGTNGLQMLRLLKISN